VLFIYEEQKILTKVITIKIYMMVFIYKNETRQYSITRILGVLMIEKLLHQLAIR
jgi:hypothetical protein